MGIRIISDTTSYIDPVLQKALNIHLAPLSVHFPDESFEENSVDYDYFYEKIAKENVIPTSSQPTVWDFLNLFKGIVSAGDEIVAIFISSAMSGTYLNACSSKKELLEEFPDAKIEIIDSRTNCMALGTIVLEAARMAKNNASFEEVVNSALKTRDKVDFYFTPKTLEYLKKGGRIGTASALLGSVLKINPILTVDMNLGMTHLFTRVRGFDGAVEKICEILAADYEKYGLNAIYVHHINAMDDANRVKDLLTGKYRNVPIEVCSIGPVIGLHVGPGTVGIVYCTKEPKHKLT